MAQIWACAKSKALLGGPSEKVYFLSATFSCSLLIVVQIPPLPELSHWEEQPSWWLPPKFPHTHGKSLTGSTGFPSWSKWSHIKHVPVSCHFCVFSRLVHVRAWLHSSFMLRAKQHCIGFIPCSLFIHQVMDSWGYAHTGNIMNSVVRIPIECLAYVAISFISLEACLGVECPDHMLKIHWTVLQSGYVTWCSHQQCVRIPFLHIVTKGF